MPNLKKRLEKTFIETIKISEVYPEEKEIIEYVEKRLQKFKIKYKKDKFKNIIATIPGQGPAVMLNTHLDVPEPNPNVKFTQEGDIIRSNGESILGCDPKSGLAILLELAEEIQKQEKHQTIELVFTLGEEKGLLGARSLDYSLITAKTGLVLDEDGPVTQVVTQAPAFVKFDAEIIGKSAHPREPKDGINALQIMTLILSNIPWGYSRPGVTWNVGLFSGGTAVNTIPGQARLNAELRSFETQAAVEEGQRIKKIFKETANKYKAKCEIKATLEFEGYQLEHQHELFKKLEKNYKAMNLKPSYFKTFGGTDANIFNAKGITCAVIGSAYYNAHQYTEYINLKEMEEILLFLKKFVKA